MQNELLTPSRTPHVLSVLARGLGCSALLIMAVMDSQSLIHMIRTIFCDDSICKY